MRVVTADVKVAVTMETGQVAAERLLEEKVGVETEPMVEEISLSVEVKLAKVEIEPGEVLKRAVSIALLLVMTV